MSEVPKHRNVRAKLTEEQAAEIRASSLPRRELARRYGVHPKTIRGVIERRTYNQQKREPKRSRKLSVQERLERLMCPEPNSGCWLWMGNVNLGGYGRIFMDGRASSMAHRVSYELYVGKIPKGMFIDHLCRVRSCVNPQHMDVVTNIENVRRGELWKVNASKTHCPKGHEYTEENTAYDKNPRGRGIGRSCKICRREKQKKQNEIYKLARRLYREAAKQCLSNTE